MYLTVAIMYLTKMHVYRKSKRKDNKNISLRTSAIKHIVFASLTMNEESSKEEWFGTELAIGINMRWKRY